MLQFIAPPLDPKEYIACFHRLADQSAFEGPFSRAYSDGRVYTQLEAVVLSPAEADHLLRLAEGAWAIGQRLTAWARQAPESLLDAVNMAPGFRRWFRSASVEPPFSRFARVDVARDESGGWHLLEFNCREPGGLPEAHLLSRVAALYRKWGLPAEDPSAGLTAALGVMLRQALPNGPVGFCSTPGFLEDYENALAAAMARGGDDAVFGGWPTVDSDGTVRVNDTAVNGLYLYLPSEGFLHHPALLDRLAVGDFPVVNPGSALFAQDKRVLALAHQLREFGGFWSEAESAWIERYLPYTSVAPFEGEWVAKPAFEREGAGVFFGEGEGPAAPEYVYQRRIHAATAPLPIWTVAGPVMEDVTPVFGVYLVDGKAAGILTRVGGPITDRNAHAVPTLILP